uniref:Uncharacterized protein n=1 Tax=Acrobeloides nanus TaxID=290746 RepID=A0A914EFM5_9BILA
MFNLSKRELLSLEMTHPILVTFLTGKLQNEALNVINNLKQYSLGEKPVNISIGRLLLAAKNELLHYFYTQNHASKTNNTKLNNIPTNLEQKFIQDLNSAYDELYYIYDSTFGVYEMAAIDDEIEKNRPSSSRVLSNPLGLLPRSVLPMLSIPCE